MSSATILIVDDDSQIRRVMRTALSSHGYTIIEARNGEEALKTVRAERLDLIVLDLNMPDMDGIEVCREIRVVSNLPIIMLTVRSAEKDKVRALDAGADDYVVKPFGIDELLARIRAALRRAPGEAVETSAVTKEMHLDFDNRTIIVKGKSVHLTPKEFELLRELVTNAGKPVSHRRLLQAVWGPDYGEEIESLRVMVNQLRKKIEPDPANPRFIRTEPWIGYRFVLPQESMFKQPR
jgi:two-component system, OmpR family, KDP operon response regulator KdpE